MIKIYYIIIASFQAIPGQAEKGVTMNEDMPVFKSFLRESLENQKEIEKALEEGDTEKALELIRKMIDRTQKGIEDN